MLGQRTRQTFGAEQIAIVVLTLVTAAIHASRAIADPEIRMLFALNSIGYLVLLGLLYLPLPQLEGRRRLIRRIFIGYTAVTIALFLVYALMPEGEVPVIGIVDKIVEVALIALLWREDRRVPGS